MTTTTMQIERREPALGATVTGVDLGVARRRDVRGAARGVPRAPRALLPRPGPSRPSSNSSSRRGGAGSRVHPYVPSLEGYPGMMEIYQVTGITETWHADTTHVAAPPKITMLLARELPADRRRHDVREHAPRVRRAVRRPARRRRRPARRALRHRARHRAGRRRQGRHPLAPGRDQAPRDGTADAVRQRQLRAPLRRLDARGEPRRCSRSSSRGPSGTRTSTATCGSPATS